MDNPEPQPEDNSPDPPNIRERSGASMMARPSAQESTPRNRSVPLRDHDYFCLTAEYIIVVDLLLFKAVFQCFLQQIIFSFVWSFI